MQVKLNYLKQAMLSNMLISDQDKRVAGKIKYFAHRVNPDERIVQTHCIMALDDEDAICLAKAVCGHLRVDLWQNSRLVKVIEP
jgi:hypothetical protein